MQVDVEFEAYRFVFDDQPRKSTERRTFPAVPTSQERYINTEDTQMGECMAALGSEHPTVFFGTAKKSTVNRNVFAKKTGLPVGAPLRRSSRKGILVTPVLSLG